jgi:hypothetical protein
MKTGGEANAVRRSAVYPDAIQPVYLKVWENDFNGARLIANKH